MNQLQKSLPVGFMFVNLTDEASTLPTMYLTAPSLIPVSGFNCPIQPHLAQIFADLFVATSHNTGVS